MREIFREAIKDVVKEVAREEIRGRIRAAIQVPVPTISATVRIVQADPNPFSRMQDGLDRNEQQITRDSLGGFAY